MLCYFGDGSRFYGDKPVSIDKRPYWEFQAVLSGAIGMRLPDQPAIMRSNHLWLSAPGHVHGWTGKSGYEAKVAVFHFPSIPELLGQRLKKGTCLEIPLTRVQRNRLHVLTESIAKGWRTPHPEMLLHHEHLLLELSLLVCEANPVSPSTQGTLQRERVNAALNWFHLHMESNPSLEDISRASGTSPAHLRRLFHEIMQSSPKKVFDQMRFQHAIHLMTDKTIKLETVGQTCGFQSASAFSRAFKSKFGCSPEQWRGQNRGQTSLPEY